VLKPGDVMITPKLDRMFRSALNALDVLAKMKAGRHFAAHDRASRIALRAISGKLKAAGMPIRTWG
jgi:hypothetical protein